MAAAVFVSQGVRVALFSGPLPTPFVAAGAFLLVGLIVVWSGALARARQRRAECITCPAGALQAW